MNRYINPSRKDFESDPFGYSALARYKWGIAQELSGFTFEFDISKPATAEELKNPILWLTQANALSEAAIAILKNEPKFENMPPLTRGMCDSQYCASALMMVGYSLEICLKAMVIITEGIDSYLEKEKAGKFNSHNLHELANFIPNMSKRERSCLRLLSIYIYWAGRYPSPKPGKEKEAEDIFSISEKNKISAKELFALATKIMKHAYDVI